MHIRDLVHHGFHTWLLFSLLLGCGPATPELVLVNRADPVPPPKVTQVEVEEAPGDFARQIPNEAMWNTLAYRPEYNGRARTEVVKVVYDLKTETLYLLASEKWELHYHFVQRFIDSKQQHATFNTQQYRRPDRRYLLGSILHYLDGDHWTFELVAGDTMSKDHLLLLYSRVRDASYFRAKLKFRALSAYQEALIAELGDALPSVRTEDVLGDVVYQPLVLGEAYGYLRIVEGPLRVDSVRPNDIIVAAEVPNELPPVSALITGKLQAPLAHVAVLSRNRGTPDMAIRNATTREELVALKGQLVKLSVGAQDFKMEAATLPEAQESWANARPKSGFTPKSDANSRALSKVCSLSQKDVIRVGAKAAQLGEVCKVEGISTPGGFAVPFSYYLNHLKKHRLLPGLKAMLRDPAFLEQRSVRASRLAQFRDIITQTTVDPALVKKVQQRVRAFGRKSILRSSTNAEDLPGFNGAGLYSSVVVNANPSRKDVRDAIAKVWASVWLQRAYEERQWYRIDHAAVAMGILIQPFVDDVIGTGVAITKNPFDQGRPGIFINVQQGASVTDAGSDEIPEQFMVYTWAEEPEVEVLSRSSLTGGKPILTQAQMVELGNQLVAVDQQMQKAWAVQDTVPGHVTAVDAEFLLTKGGTFVMLQARPYPVVYQPGQRYRN